MHPCPSSAAGIGRAFVTVAVPAATVKVPGRRKGVSVNNLDGVRGSERSQKSKITSKPMPKILRESPASRFQH
jgi:hypothetical protein